MLKVGIAPPQQILIMQGNFIYNLDKMTFS